MIVVMTDSDRLIKNKNNNMKKINMKRVSELEATYSTNPISLNALQGMIDIVMTPQRQWDNNAYHYELAVNTLIDLGVIEKMEAIQQLNS
jgi:hypothetical protein